MRGVFLGMVTMVTVVTIESAAMPSTMLAEAYTTGTYSPNDFVKELHSVYHHDNADQFSTDRDSDFVTAIVMVGAAPFIATVLLLGIYFVLLLYRCCKASCASKEACCGPTFSRVFLSFLFLASLVFGMGMWGARYDFNSAVDKMSYAMSNSEGTGLVNIFSNVETSTTKLQAQAAQYKQLSLSFTCPGNTGALWSGSKTKIQQYALAFKEAADQLPSYYEDASASLDDINVRVEKMSKTHVNLGIGAVFAIVVFYAFLGVSAAGQRSYKLLDCTSCWASLVLPAMAVVLGLELGLSVLVSDYCSHDAVTCNRCIHSSTVHSLIYSTIYSLTHALTHDAVTCNR
jgi:hypothetical protein